MISYKKKKKKSKIFFLGLYSRIKNFNKWLEYEQTILRASTIKFSISMIFWRNIKKMRLLKNFKLKMKKQLKFKWNQKIIRAIYSRTKQVLQNEKNQKLLTKKRFSEWFL